MNIYEAESAISGKHEWNRWREELPYIKWPKSWLVKAVPPFGGAIIRYLITLEGLDDRISVYLDCYNRLGYFWDASGSNPAPYWEVYPVEGDVYRCPMNDIDRLLKGIRAGLRELKRKKKRLSDKE